MKTHIDGFLLYLSKDKHYSKHTLSNYQRDLDQCETYLRGAQLDHIELSHIECRDYVSWLQKKGYRRNSILRKVAALRSFWHYLLNLGLVRQNSWTQLTLPKPESKLPNTLSEKSIQDVLSTPAKDIYTLRDLCILAFLFATGCRVSELVSIQLSDLSLDAQECHIRGKGKKERIVLFGEQAKRHLETYLRLARPQWVKKATDTLFLSQKGTPLSVRSVQRLLKKHFPSELQTVTPHQIRHSFATTLLNNGAPLTLVQTCLGHESVNTTQLYTHVSNELLEKTYRKAHPRA